MNKLKISLIVLLFFFSGVALSSAQQSAVSPPLLPDDGPMIQAPPLRMIAPGIFEIDGCRIIKKENRIEFPAEINMDNGLLEYVLVGNSGKLHESLLRTRVSPYAIQISLLLLGLEGTPEPLAEQGQNRIPGGDRVQIKVSWKNKGHQQIIPVAQWISKGGKAVRTIPWVFTGSVIMDGVFLAQVEKSVIAVYHDPTALIDHQLAEGSNDEIWQVNSATVPPKGTKVKIIIEKLTK